MSHPILLSDKFGNSSLNTVNKLKGLYYNTSSMFGSALSEKTKILLNGTDQFGEFCPVFDQIVTHIQHLNTRQLRERVV